MRKILAGFIIILSMALPVLVLSGSAAAVNVFHTCPPTSSIPICQDVQPQTGDPIIGLLKDAMEIVSFITGIAAVILIVVSGLRFVTAGGDPGGVAKARGSLTYALVGVAVTALAQAIIIFVLNHVN